MSSSSLETLQTALEEISDLQKVNPVPKGGISVKPPVTRAITRASIVLLCSHFERYLKSLNEEAIECLNRSKIAAVRLPVRMRLLHSRKKIEEIARTEWINREKMLQEFALSDAWLWMHQGRGNLVHKELRMITGPMPKELIRFFRIWGIEDIFREITRKEKQRRLLFLKLTELVEKRNNIAHGDFQTEATSRDISSYRTVVWKFSERVDRRLARLLRVKFKVVCSWY